MELPIRISRAPVDAPSIVVDGHGPAAVLELSHWPGNRTPAALRHELSTGCALAFARLEEAERRRLAGGATALVNNHYDTDGVLALFAASRPDLALPRASALLDAAAAGDFFRWPDDRALGIDAIVLGVDRSPASPLATEIAGLDADERWTRCARWLVEALPAMLDGELGPWSALWEPTVAAAHEDRDTLDGCERHDDPARDLTSWIAPRGVGVLPGRHALFGATEADRVLVLAPDEDGTRTRLVLSTLSWFEPTRFDRQARPDLARLAARLNELEGASPDDEVAWRAQPADGASPELWFGTEELELFVERNQALRPSALAPRIVRGEVERALAHGP